jgi:hypothetical protein
MAAEKAVRVKREKEESLARAQKAGYDSRLKGIAPAVHTSKNARVDAMWAPEMTPQGVRDQIKRDRCVELKLRRQMKARGKKVGAFGEILN